jgi:hypothetical protein
LAAGDADWPAEGAACSGEDFGRLEEESAEEESDAEESDGSAAKIAAPTSIKDAKAQCKRKPPDINTSCRSAGFQTAQAVRNRVLHGEWESQPKSVSESDDAVVGGVFRGQAGML